MTAPEAAKAMDCVDSSAYRWAKQNGVKWVSKKRGASRERMLELQVIASEKRLAALREHFRKVNATPVNGWTWSQLHEAGFTACEAARVRGMTPASAYIWAKRHGREWKSHFADPKRTPIAGLSPEDRAEYLRMKCYNLTGDERLRILGRADLVEGKLQGDPIEHMVKRMRADAESATRRRRDLDKRADQ